jgi:hypothetical protein
MVDGQTIFLVSFLMVIGTVNLYQAIQSILAKRRLVKERLNEGRLIEKCLITVSRVDIKPSDVIVITSPRTLPKCAIVHIRESLERYFPGHKCLVLEDGVSMKLAHG